MQSMWMRQSSMKRQYGRINNEQLIKLNTFGLNEEEAEAVIIENFLR